MDIKDLIVFLQVYEDKSMNKAAQSLFISTQSISKIIKQLESEFGATLFERKTSGVVPTYEATLLMPKIKYLINDFHDLKNVMQNNRHLRVAVTGGIFSYLTPRFIYDFQQFHPNIQLEIIELQDSMIDEVLWNESIEIGIRSGAVNQLNYNATFFTRHRFCVILPRNHPLAHQEFIHYADLKDETLIIVKGFNFYHGFFNANVVPNIMYETAEVSCFSKFSAEHNIITISIDCVAFQQQNNDVVIKPFADITCTWDTYIVEKKNRPLSKNACIFKEFALNWLQTHKDELFYWNVVYPEMPQ